jgi:hypothetical protein
MDQDVINIIIGTVLSVLGWFARQLWDAVQSLKADMQKIEISLPTHYVRKDELEQRFDKLEAMLDKIYEKLDHKVDK